MALKDFADIEGMTAGVHQYQSSCAGNPRSLPLKLLSRPIPLALKRSRPTIMCLSPDTIRKCALVVYEA